MRVLTALIIINIIATGYAVFTVRQQANTVREQTAAIDNLGNAMGQVAQVFIKSRIVERAQDGNINVNSVVTLSDLQQSIVPQEGMPPNQ